MLFSLISLAKDILFSFTMYPRHNKYGARNSGGEPKGEILLN